MTLPRERKFTRRSYKLVKQNFSPNFTPKEKVMRATIDNILNIKVASADNFAIPYIFVSDFPRPWLNKQLYFSIYSWFISESQNEYKHEPCFSKDEQIHHARYDENIDFI